MNRPCIRGLKAYKKGCPEKPWDGKNGCPAWREYFHPQQSGSDKKVLAIADCIDCLSEYWLHEALKLNETVIKTTESFRNGMCETAQDGKVYPKMDRAVLGLVGLLKREKEDRLLVERNKKQLI